LLVATTVHAEEKREADAHEHGHGTFNMAIEGETVVIELETPSFDILGFEYAASSDAEKAAVDKAQEALSSPAALFGLPKDAGCSVTEAEIEFGADEEHHDDEHHGDKHHDDEHHDDEHHDDAHDDDEHHDDAHDDDHHEDEAHHDDHHEDEAHHDDHDKHDDHAEHHDEDASEHSEVHAHYVLTCDSTESINAVNMRGYFETFPNAEELDAAILSDTGQASGELEPDNPELAL